MAGMQSYGTSMMSLMGVMSGPAPLETGLTCGLTCSHQSVAKVYGAAAFVEPRNSPNIHQLSSGWTHARGPQQGSEALLLHKDLS